jgi:hypothetical protein
LAPFEPRKIFHHCRCWAFLAGMRKTKTAIFMKIGIIFALAGKKMLEMIAIADGLFSNWFWD